MVLALALVVPGAAEARDYLVNTNVDGLADGDCDRTTCKLRDAVELGNSRRRQSVCAPIHTCLRKDELTLDGVRIEGAGALTTVINGR